MSPAAGRAHGPRERLQPQPRSAATNCLGPSQGLTRGPGAATGYRELAARRECSPEGWAGAAGAGQKRSSSPAGNKQPDAVPVSQHQPGRRVRLTPEPCQGGRRSRAVPTALRAPWRPGTALRPPHAPRAPPGPAPPYTRPVRGPSCPLWPPRTALQALPAAAPRHASTVRCPTGCSTSPPLPSQPWPAPPCSSPPSRLPRDNPGLSVAPWAGSAH